MHMQETSKENSNLPQICLCGLGRNLTDLNGERNSVDSGKSRSRKLPECRCGMWDQRPRALMAHPVVTDDAHPPVPDAQADEDAHPDARTDGTRRC